MPWIVGIDEAGYGPNLGPFVQAATSIVVPPQTTLDPLLKEILRRTAEKDKKRILVDDSKKVNTGVHGLRKLERSLFATILQPGKLGDILESVASAEAVDDLRQEKWFRPEMELPLEAGNGEEDRKLWTEFAEKHGLRWELTGLVIMPALRFNAVLARADTKGAIPVRGMIELLNATLSRSGTENVRVWGDRLGGRSHYAGVLRQVDSEEVIVKTISEAEELSEYRIEGRAGLVEVSIQVEAESQHFPVALASMAAKYFREVCMLQFNEWWSTQIPGLKPTAGYPLDAKRFFAEIEAKMAELRIPRVDVWRLK